MQKWIATGVSGSGRIELFDELGAYLRSLGKHVLVHNIGTLIQQECERIGIPFTARRVLDLDSDLLKSLRSAALKEAILQAHREPNAEFQFISTHATFRWKNRLIPGISFSDLKELNPDGFVNVVDDVNEIVQTNKMNPKWEPGEAPDYEETQDWMTEEEFIAEFLAAALKKPMYLVAKEHHIHNLAELFLSPKKKIYLSYPITAVEKDNPDLLQRVQGPILKQLEELFVVFNPLTIRDMSFARDDLPTRLEELTPKAKEIIKARTVARDFQFIDQADAVVVFYLTEKVSPGVLAEVFYAHRTQKPVFMIYPYARSPFIEEAVSYMTSEIDPLIECLKAFAGTSMSSSG